MSITSILHNSKEFKENYFNFMSFIETGKTLLDKMEDDITVLYQSRITDLDRETDPLFRITTQDQGTLEIGYLNDSGKVTIKNIFTENRGLLRATYKPSFLSKEENVFVKEDFILYKLAPVLIDISWPHLSNNHYSSRRVGLEGENFFRSIAKSMGLYKEYIIDDLVRRIEEEAVVSIDSEDLSIHLDLKDNLIYINSVFCHKQEEVLADWFYDMYLLSKVEYLIREFLNDNVNILHDVYDTFTKSNTVADE